jgi:hypothetical protein
VGYRTSNHDETVMFGDGAVGETVLAARGSLEHTLFHKPGEILAVDGSLGGVSGGNCTPSFDESDEAVAGGHRHV